MKILYEATGKQTSLCCCNYCGVIFTLEKSDLEKSGTKHIEHYLFKKNREFWKMKCPTTYCNTIFTVDWNLK